MSTGSVDDLVSAVIGLTPVRRSAIKPCQYESPEPPPPPRHRLLGGFGLGLVAVEVPVSRLALRTARGFGRRIVERSIEHFELWAGREIFGDHIGKDLRLA